MKNEDICTKFGRPQDKLYQISIKLFYMHPEYLDTDTRQSLYSLATKKCVEKIMKNTKKMTEDEAKSILLMRCSMSAKIRAAEIESYKDIVFSFADEIYK